MYTPVTARVKTPLLGFLDYNHGNPNCLTLLKWNGLKYYVFITFLFNFLHEFRSFSLNH